MAKTILIAGYGPGISNAVAEKFGAEGFQVALVARNEERLAAGVKALAAKGVKAAAFPADFSDPATVKSTIGKVRAALGPITVLDWGLYKGGAGDLLAAKVEELGEVVAVATTSLLAAVQALLPDLRADKESAVLVTNGALGFFNEPVDKASVQWGAMGLSIANSAKHKLVRLLHHKLGDEGIYVGEVMVSAVVKGSAFDREGNGTLEASNIAAKFWEIYRARKEVSVTI